MGGFRLIFALLPPFSADPVFLGGFGDFFGASTPRYGLAKTTSTKTTTTTGDPDVPANAVQPGIPGTNDDLDVKVVEVGPELAEEWLKRNRRNRRIRPERVTRYARQMKDGEWTVSPDAIAFDYSGKLINGQHRLEAIIEADTTAQFLLAIGLEPDAFKISDVGVKRTGGDILRIEGFKNAEELAAATRLMVLWSQDRLEEANKYENVYNDALVEMANLCSQVDPDSPYWSLPEAVREVNAIEKKRYKGLVPRSMMAFAVFAYQFSFPDRAKSFFHGIVGKEGFLLEKWEEKYGPSGGKEDYKNPVNLYKYRMKTKYDSLTRDRVLGYLIKAMNMYCLQKPHKKLRFRESDHFPEIEIDLPDFL